MCGATIIFDICPCPHAGKILFAAVAPVPANCIYVAAATVFVIFAFASATGSIFPFGNRGQTISVSTGVDGHSPAYAVKRVGYARIFVILVYVIYGVKPSFSLRLLQYSIHSYQLTDSAGRRGSLNFEGL